MVGMRKTILGVACLFVAGVGMAATGHHHGIRIINDTPHQHRWNLQNVSCNTSSVRPGAHRPADCESGTLGATNSLSWMTQRVPLPSQSCSYQVLIDGKIYCKGLCLDETKPVVIANGDLSGFKVKCPKPSHSVHHRR